MAANELEALPEWVDALARRIEPKQRRVVARKIAQELRKSNRERTKGQKDADNNQFIKPLKRENNPMFREITAIRYFKAKGTDRQAMIGFAGSAGRIAQIHQDGARSEVRPGSRKFPFPKRTLVGINALDERMVLALLQDLLTKGYV